ncbi:MAG: S-layer homology domain-containing protein, partial [Sedimentibacter sp.]
LSSYIENGILTVVKAKVIGKDGKTIDVDLYVNDGPTITELSGGFEAPANLTDEDIYYGAEIYFDKNNSGEFNLLYSMTEPYVISPIVYIDDESDLEISYTNWPSTNTILASDETSISLGYIVNNNATWQSLVDFSWSSSDDTVANITEDGDIVLTGNTGQVTFTLTALNASLPGKEFSIYSETLEVMEATTTFLHVTDSVKNIEITKGNDAKVYYSTNLTSSNDTYVGSGTVTTYTYGLYEAKYVDAQLEKGNFVNQQTLDASVDDDIMSYTVDEQYLVNTSVKGKYSYILEISAKDMQLDTILSTSANICVKELPAKAVLSKPQNYYIEDDDLKFTVEFNIENSSQNTECNLSVIKNEEDELAFTTDDIENINKEITVTIDPVESNRLLDIYTILLVAKNEFDEAYSYDSYVLYVYNSDALKIMVNDVATDNLTMSMDDELSKMTSYEILALNRNISLNEEISINNKQYKWSNIADKITWEVSDDSKISLEYNDGGSYENIENYLYSSFLPGSDFLLQGKSSGDSIITATHNATGKSVELDVTVDKLEDKLYIFQVYPIQKSTVTYTNGEDKYKTVVTDTRGRVAIFEKSGIKSDVCFKPEYSGTYDQVTLKNNSLMANQRSVNDFGLYPQNNVIFPITEYKITFNLCNENDYEWYNGDVIIRGGVYRNGKYCPTAKINGISGSEDQIVSADSYGNYSLDFNSSEFTTANNSGPLTSDDKIEYVIEVNFPDNSHYTKIIKVSSQIIKQYRGFYFGVYLQETIKKLDSAKIQNNVSIISQTLTIDGIEQQMPEQVIFEEAPDSAFIDIEMMFKGDTNKNYEISFVDEYNEWNLFSNTIKESYEFSSTVILRNTYNIRKRVLYLLPGEKTNLYMNIVAKDADSLTEIKLPTPIKIYNLDGIPNMDTLISGDLAEVTNNIISTVTAPYYVTENIDNDNVKRTLDFLERYSFGSSSTGLEIQATDDPLVYKGIIKFAAGDLSSENPSGVYSADENSSEKFKFMPGLSDVKAIKKGDYIKKSIAQMKKNKLGSKGTYKTYGGGAYLECEIFYDTIDREWKILLIKSNTYVGAGGGYYRYFNTWVGPIPVTAEFRTGLSAQIGLKTALNVYYTDEDKDEYDVLTDYITEVNPYFYIYGFGGFGADYEVASLKVGPYGQISLNQRYLWLNSEEEKKNGQKITISGETGIKFTAKVFFIKYTKEYELAEVSKSWKYNDFDEIDNIYNGKSGFTKEMFLSSYGGIALVPVSETVTLEDRSYLDIFDRQWYVPLLRKSSDEAITIIQTNAYPTSNPVLTDDGMIMAYVSDMDSHDINDTAVCFSMKDGGLYAPGTEIDASNYADSDVVIDGTSDGAAVAWTRVISELDKSSGDEATPEDIQEMISGTEIMASIYDGTKFNTTRLTNNSTPDMAPVVATNGKKTIVAWRSLYATDRDNPLDFDGRDNIMYSIFNGSSWSEAKCLYDGSIDNVKALNAKMLSDGTFAITYEVNMKDTENTENYCAILDENGNIINNIRLTNNEIKDENPRITSVVFPDGIERFIIGWNTIETVDDEVENTIRLSAINNKGILYSLFETEIEDTTGASNFNSFEFTKGAEELDDLSIVWTEPTDETDDENNNVYNDIIWGKKFIEEEDGSITESAKIKLLELDDQNVVDFLNSYVDDDTKAINFAMLLSDYSDDASQAKLAVGKSSYKNNLVVDGTYFSADDLLPNLDMPVLFSLYNDGVEPIEKITINIGGVDHVFDTYIRSGEYKDFTVLYMVPENIVNPDYSVTAKFLTSTDTKNGTLNMDVPDVGIFSVDITKEEERERMFSVQLYNNTYSKLKEGKHVVKLQVFDTPDFETTPLVTKSISDQESLNIINDGVLMQEITLTEKDLQGILDYDGEIIDGSRMFFNALLEENETVIEDSDISNDSDYLKIDSLITKNSSSVSITSLMQAESDNTVVQIEALNNSMNKITNGNITVNLRDEDGNIIETQQTYNVSDIDNGLIIIEGEETIYTTFNFGKQGSSYDVVFSNVDNDSLLLSQLKFTGVPLDFDKSITDYNLQVTDLDETIITAVSENPSSVITVFQDGQLISNLEPCELSYGTNLFEIVVKTNTNEVTYTVTIDDTEVEDDSDDNNNSKYYNIVVIQNEGGEISPTYGRVAEGKNKMFTITPDEGYEIADVLVGGASVGAVDTYNFVNTRKSTSIKAVFKKKDNEQNSIEFENPFIDVNSSDWFYDAVGYVNENGLMNGISEKEFAPSLELTRGMFITVLYRMENEPDVEETKFTDVKSNDYYQKAVAWATVNGIVTGVSETNFAPNDSITREQMATIIYRYAKYKNKEPEGTWAIKMDYNDLSDISDYASEGAMFCKLKGIMMGNTKNQLLPKANANRAETATVIQRIIENILN